MVQDYDGAEVVDAQGERIGTIERSYVDDSGTARFVEVAIGAFFPKHRLIPLAGAEMTSGRLVVPYTLDMIVESPDASSISETLEGELLEQVQAHYALDRESTDVETTGSTEEGTPVVAGEVITPEPPPDEADRVVEEVDRVVEEVDRVVEEVDRVVEEEVVVVKRRVVKEVLRVHTGPVIEPQPRPERVEVAQDGDAVVQDEEDTDQGRRYA